MILRAAFGVIPQALIGIIAEKAVFFYCFITKSRRIFRIYEVESILHVYSGADFDRGVSRCDGQRL